MDISIVVITHNKLSWVKGVLRTLEATDYPRDGFEVIVVDDGSTDDTASFLESYAPSYGLKTRSQPQSGRAAARNTGCRLAEGQWIVTLDDDCLMPADALSTIWQTAQEHPKSMLLMSIDHVAVEHVPSVLERIAAGDEDVFPSLQGMAPDDGDYALEELFRRMLRTDMGRYAVPWTAAQGSSAAFPAAMFHDIGGYDEGFTKYGMEDFEFALRAFRADYRFVALPEVRYFHLDHGHAKRELFKESTDSVRYFYRKYGGAPEVSLFIRFLCGALSFRDLNNRIAETLGLEPIDDLDLRFSPYGMVDYRDRQKDDEKKTLGPEDEAASSQESPSAAQAVAKNGGTDSSADGSSSKSADDSDFEYSSGQQVKMRYLLSKLARDLGDGGEGLGSLPRAETLQPRRVLVLAPHMDDEVIGCGGLIRRWTQDGAHVRVAFLTNGAPEKMRHPDLPGLRRARRQESLRALEILGTGEPIFLDLPDGELSRFEADPQPLRDLLQQEQPDLLLVPADTEYHPDHRATYRWASAALAHLDEPPTLLCYEVCGNCQPNRVHEIDDATWQVKLEAMQVYRTQMQDMDYCRIMGFVAETRGRAAAFDSGATRAEAYRLEVRGETS